MLDGIYINSVRLLLDIIPAVFVDGQYAIKGGTAINLFGQRRRGYRRHRPCLPQRNRTHERRVLRMGIDGLAAHAASAWAPSLRRHGLRVCQPTPHAYEAGVLGWHQGLDVPASPA